MAKKKPTNVSELLFLSLLVLVIVSSVMVVFQTSRQARPVEAAVEGARTVSTESAAELMKMLKMTIDDGGQSDFVQLRKDASGL